MCVAGCADFQIIFVRDFHDIAQEVMKLPFIACMANEKKYKSFIIKLNYI